MSFTLLIFLHYYHKYVNLYEIARLYKLRSPVRISFFGTAYKVGLGNYYILVGLIEATDEYCHVNRGHDQMM